MPDSFFSVTVESTKYIFEGPHTSWKKLCEEVFEEAAKLAVEVEEANGLGNIIYSESIVRRMFFLLSERGYKEVEACEGYYFDDVWITPKLAHVDFLNRLPLSEKTRQRIYAYNDRVTEKEGV